MACPFCESTNIIKGKKKYKCMDCHKSFLTPKTVVDKSVPLRQDDIKGIEKLLRKATRPDLGHLVK